MRSAAFESFDYFQPVVAPTLVAVGSQRPPVRVGLLGASDLIGRARFMAANNESGELMELLQLQNSEGPGLGCMASGVPVVNARLSEAEDQWPTFAPQAIAAGFGSVHAFPMRLRGEVIGALNLFGTTETTFADDEVRVVQALADIATIAILQERSITRAETLPSSSREHSTPASSSNRPKAPWPRPTASPPQRPLTSYARPPAQPNASSATWQRPCWPTSTSAPVSSVRRQHRS